MSTLSELLKDFSILLHLLSVTQCCALDKFIWTCYLDKNFISLSYLDKKKLTSNFHLDKNHSHLDNSQNLYLIVSNN
jgi:hypothetical protein